MRDYYGDTLVAFKPENIVPLPRVRPNVPRVRPNVPPVFQRLDWSDRFKMQFVNYWRRQISVMDTSRVLVAVLVDACRPLAAWRAFLGQFVATMGDGRLDRSVAMAREPFFVPRVL